jgi:hypothetical protein
LQHQLCARDGRKQLPGYETRAPKEQLARAKDFMGVKPANNGFAMEIGIGTVPGATRTKLYLGTYDDVDEAARVYDW